MYELKLKADSILVVEVDQPGGFIEREVFCIARDDKTFASEIVHNLNHGIAWEESEVAA